MYVELVFVNTIIVSLWNTMRNHTSHNVDVTLVLLHPEPMCQWDTLRLLCASGTQRRHKEMRADSTTCLCVSVVGLCLTLNPGHAKLLTKRQRKRVTWF